MSSGKAAEEAEMDGKVTELEEQVVEEMRLVEEGKNCGEGDDFYAKMVDNMTGYFEKLTELYHQVVVMRLESVRAKLEYLKSRQNLESLDNSLACCWEDAGYVQK